MTALGALLAALIGLTLGLLGGGGSILTVPVFVYVLGFEAKEAIAMSLAVVGAVSLVGAAGHWRAGNVDLRAAVAFGAFAMAGTFGGARLSAFFSGAAQLTVFAVVMLAAAVFMFRGRHDDGEAAPGRMRLLPTAAVGVGVGVLTGLVGVGGGFMIVPALVLLARVPMRRAVGTSLLVISMNAATGFAGYLGRVEVPWGFMAAFAAVAVAGILAGAWLVRFVPQRALRRGFAVFLLAMGTAILWQNRAVLVPGAHAAPPEAGAAAR